MTYFDDITNYCEELLLNFSDAKGVADYTDKRLSKAGQKKFRFGYFPSNQNLELLISVLGEEKLAQMDLIYDKVIQDGVSARKIRHATLENHNLIMPYRDVYGNIIALVGRTILAEEERKSLDLPKYKNTSFDKSKHLFGLYEAKQTIVKNNIVYVVEGQFDCITAQDKGLNNVVALGSSNMTFEQFALLCRYTNNIILLLDNDDAGKVGADRIMKLYSKHANIKKGILPYGFKDVDEYLTDNTVESLIYTLK
jgi:DNA primase catalytic core